MSTSIPIAIESETTTSKCLECKKPFSTRRMDLYDLKITPSLCEACADKRDTNQAAWAALCPLAFRTPKECGGLTDLKKMDAACPGWRKILDWKYGHRGLLIRGETGRCKTRAMWRLIRQLFDERKKIVELTSARFDRQCRDAGGNFTISPWFDKLATVDILFIDDLGKASWTQNTDSQFFDLIDRRTREGRPVLVTTNDSGESLEARLPEDRGGPLVRRLRDYCQTIVF